MPERLRIGANIGIRIERVHTIGLRRHKDNVVGAFAGNRQLGHIKRLRVYLTVYRVFEEFAEPIVVDVRGCNDYFVNILTSPAVVIVVSFDVDLRAAQDG